MDEEYDEEQLGQQFQYHATQEVQLHKMIKCLLMQCHNGQSLLPGSLVRKICQGYGLQCTDETFYNMLGHMVDYSLNELLLTVCDSKESGKYKKQSKQAILRTSELQNVLEERNVFICKPRIIPELNIEQKLNNVHFSFQQQQQQ